MKRYFQTIVVVLCVLALSGTLLGQATASSSLTGTVEDKSGAVVVGAAVTATSPDTGLTRATTTGDLGLYRDRKSVV